MNKDTNTGGPAFPCDRIKDDQGNWHNSSGMTMRDYFAAKAMQGLLAGSPSTLSALSDRTHSDGSVSDVAYKMADAMLKARSA
jgi:hypothetical protein